MKHIKRLLALILAVSLLAGFAVSVSAAGTTTQDEVTFKEAEELLRYLGKLGPLGGKDFGGQAKRNISVSEAAAFIKGWKNDDVGMSGSQDVTAYEFVQMMLKYLRMDPWENIAMQAVNNRLFSGIFHMNTWDEAILKSTPVTREEAAQIMLNTLYRNWTDESGDTFRMYYLYGVWRELLCADDQLDGFSRPHIQWRKLGTGEAVTGVYTPQPVYEFQAAPGTMPTCEIMDKVGYFEVVNNWIHNFHIIDGWFQFHNSKTHWGHEDTSGCQVNYNLPVYNYGVTVQIFEYDPYDSWAVYDDSYGNYCELFRVISYFSYLGKITTNADGCKVINVYGGQNGTSFGEWTQDKGSIFDSYEDGWYVFHVDTCDPWSFEVVEKVRLVQGQLTKVSDKLTGVNGVNVNNSAQFLYGKSLVSSSNLKNELYFMLDQYGNVLGCSKTNPLEDGDKTLPGTILPGVIELPFKDVDTDKWYFRDIYEIYVSGLMNGTSKTAFSPNAATTRSMIWTVLARKCNAKLTEGELWYSGAQEWAQKTGISDGSDPTGNITREQLVTMLWRNEDEPKSDQTLEQFSDAASVSAWAVEAMCWAVENGIIKGSDGKLNPLANATRAEVAAMIMRY